MRAERSQPGWANVRVLIIDDASPDCTVEVATQLSSEDSRVTFVRHPHNKGHIVTYNDGIYWASSEYYMILSADDYLLSGALANVDRFMDAHSNTGLAYSRAITLDPCGTTLPAIFDHTTESQWQVLSGLQIHHTQRNAKYCANSDRGSFRLLHGCLPRDSTYRRFSACSPAMLSPRPAGHLVSEKWR
jgi:glycosyltransferase involved in cell wall biosynthesis